MQKPTNNETIVQGTTGFPTEKEIINQLEVITNDNQLKEQSIKALQIYLEANQCVVDIESFTISPDTLANGYKVYIILETGGYFVLIQAPKQIKFIISSLAGVGLNRSKLKLAHLLIGYNLQTKNPISFNLDFLQKELNSYQSNIDNLNLVAN